MDDVKKLVANVQSAGEAFYDVVFPDERLSEAAFHARLRIGQSLKKWPHLHVSEMDDFNNAMICFLEAAGLVAKDLKDGRDSRADGIPQWDVLIIGLTKWFKSKGLRTGASKGSDKSTNTSPFVAFIHELQLIFPKECQRHMASLVALSKAINNARRRKVDARDLKSENARSECPA